MAIETPSHLLLHCLAAAGAWQHSHLGNQNGAGDELHSMLDRWLNQGGSNSGLFVNRSMVTWWVWKNRWKWVFEGIPFSAEATRARAESALQCSEGDRRPLVFPLLSSAGMHLRRARRRSSRRLHRPALGISGCCLQMPSKQSAASGCRTRDLGGLRADPRPRPYCGA